MNSDVCHDCLELIEERDRLRALLRECLQHIDLLEGHLPMANPEDEAVYKESILFGERIAKEIVK
jgi:hypothetical protein